MQAKGDACFILSIRGHVTRQNTWQNFASPACLGAPVEWHAAQMSSLSCRVWVRAQGSQSQAEPPAFNSIQEAKVQNMSPLVLKLDRTLLVIS